MIFNLMKPVPVADVEPDEPTATIPTDLTANNFYGTWIVNEKPNLADFEQVADFGVPKLFGDKTSEYFKLCCDTEKGEITAYYYGTSGSELGYLLYQNVLGGFMYEQHRKWIFPNHGQAVSETFYRWMLENAVYLSASEPIIYYYNGTVLPKLPEWDKTAYPYAQIRKRKLYLSSSPITYNTSTWKYAYSAPYLLANFTYSADVMCWGEVTENETQPTGYEDTLWSNHNILDENGNVHFEASVPVPISLPFTLFDGEITTTKPDYSEYSYGRTYELLYGYKSGDTLRITFDGETKEYSGATLQTNISNGGDFGIHALQPWSIWKWYAEIETKTAGTHTLKIELIGVK